MIRNTINGARLGRGPAGARGPGAGSGAGSAGWLAQRQAGRLDGKSAGLAGSQGQWTVLTVQEAATVS